jgi:hypothetical protein
VTPGTVVIERWVGGVAVLHRVVEVAAGSTVSVEVGDTAASEAPPGPPSRVTSWTSSVPEGAQRGNVSWSAWPFVIAGAGLATVGASALLYALRANALAATNAYCTLDTSSGIYHCANTPQAVGDFADAGTFGTASLVTAIAGSVVAATGIAWLAVDLLRPRHRSAVVVEPTVLGALQVRGSF